MFRRRFRMPLLAIAATAMALGLALAHATPARATGGPYASALTRADGAVPLASTPRCDGRLCEFIAPGFHCLFDGSKNLCQTGTSGCTNVACH